MNTMKIILPSTATHSSPAAQSPGKLSQVSGTHASAKILKPSAQSHEKPPAALLQTWLVPVQGLPKHSSTSSQDPARFLENPSPQGTSQLKPPERDFEITNI